MRAGRNVLKQTGDRSTVGLTCSADTISWNELTAMPNDYAVSSLVADCDRILLSELADQQDDSEMFGLSFNSSI